jgi:hypothetical protein
MRFCDEKVLDDVAQMSEDDDRVIRGSDNQDVRQICDGLSRQVCDIICDARKVRPMRKNNCLDRSCPVFCFKRAEMRCQRKSDRRKIGGRHDLRRRCDAVDRDVDEGRRRRLNKRLQHGLPEGGKSGAKKSGGRL